MKASEVLQQYHNGQRTFHRLNLRGANFAGKDLSGADFSYCDIRGANFSQANLIEVNFTKAKAGLSSYWMPFFLLFSFIFATLAGFTSSIIFTFVYYFLREKKPNPFYIFICSTAFITLIRNRLAWIEELVKELNQSSDLTLIKMIYSVLIEENHMVKLQINVAILIIIAIAFFGASVAVIDEPKSGTGSVLILTFILIVILLISLPFSQKELPQLNLTIGELLGGIIGAILGSWFSQQAISRDQKFYWLWKKYLDFANFGGTHFNNANLKNANFSGAILKGTDFRTKKMTRTKFVETKFSSTRLATTILANPTVRDLLINPSNGEGIDLFKADLRGANLNKANLQVANLSQADSSEASFVYANLKDANLTEVNAVKTNFSDATLTGACLENWNIDATTILENVDCQYVYLLNHHQERRPSSGEFQGDEFTKLFKEVFDTVDLIFRKGIDWKAFLSAMEEVQEQNEDTPLQVQSIENKGDGVVVVKVQVSPDANKEKIHQDFNEIYQLKLEAVEARYKAQLAAKETEITLYRQQNIDMMEITKTLANRPINVEAKAVNHSYDSSRSIKAERDVNISDSVVNLGEIMGEVHHTINQIP